MCVCVCERERERERELAARFYEHPYRRRFHSICSSKIFLHVPIHKYKWEVNYVSNSFIPILKIAYYVLFNFCITQDRIFRGWVCVCVDMGGGDAACKQGLNQIQKLFRPL